MLIVKQADVCARFHEKISDGNSYCMLRAEIKIEFAEKCDEHEIHTAAEMRMKKIS